MLEITGLAPSSLNRTPAESFLQQAIQQDHVNTPIFNNIIAAVTKMAGNINGRETGITNLSDVVERGLLRMAGISTIPEKTSFMPSHKKAGLGFIDFKGISRTDADCFVAYLNNTFGKFGSGVAKSVDPIGDDDASISVDLNVMLKSVIPAIGRYLPTLAKDDPDLIRFFQHQSGAQMNFPGKLPSGKGSTAPYIDDSRCPEGVRCS